MPIAVGQRRRGRIEQIEGGERGRAVAVRRQRYEPDGHRFPRREGHSVDVVRVGEGGDDPGQSTRSNRQSRDIVCVWREGQGCPGGADGRQRVVERSCLPLDPQVVRAGFRRDVVEVGPGSSGISATEGVGDLVIFVGIADRRGPRDQHVERSFGTAGRARVTTQVDFLPRDEFDRIDVRWIARTHCLRNRRADRERDPGNIVIGRGKRGSGKTERQDNHARGSDNRRGHKATRRITPLIMPPRGPARPDFRPFTDEPSIGRRRRGR